MQRKTKEEVIVAFQKIHGDRYDYSLVEYTSNGSKVKIICKIHGVFEPIPSNHLKGSGCPDCGGNTRYDDEKIIAAFRKVHGDRYDYSNVKYVSAKKKVKINCKIQRQR